MCRFVLYFLFNLHSIYKTVQFLFCFSFFRFEQRYLNLFSFLSTSMGDHVEQLKLLTMKAIKSITSQNASNVIDEFHLSMDKRETSGTVSQLGPSTSQSDIELSISDADSGFLEQSDDISQNEQQAVPGTDLPTSVPVLHLNRVDDGVTSSTTDGNNLNVPDLSTSVSIVALNGVDDGVSSSTSHGNGLNSSDLSTSVSIIQLNSVDDSVMTYGSDSNSVPTEHDGKSQEGPIDANANGIMCINESKDAILQVLYL